MVISPSKRKRKSSKFECQPDLLLAVVAFSKPISVHHTPSS
ncbi:hypothetical protein SLEP1_g29427 [Rubroshorea leprosula]|uniref:Uncharacterized protein n=1 Tax=Rubroshorea leprosula TaxID=152421 RepID=A0AAV5JWW1_9ROSI|nr:hypothetical protein SLEP1_g29427 [Rubroshorea leprosula]